MRNRIFATLLGLLLPGLVGAQEVHVPRVVPIGAAMMRPAVLAIAAALTAQPVVLSAPAPILQPVVLSAPAPILRPIVLPKALQAASFASVASEARAVRSQSQEADPAAQSIALSKIFDNSVSASAAAIDYPGVPNERRQGADSSVIEAQRAFRKELKAISHGAPLTKAHADFLIQKARELGVPIRIHASDLQTQNNHWERGPHIHIGSFHVPVEPGYVPELLPGFINPN